MDYLEDQEKEDNLVRQELMEYQVCQDHQDLLEISLVGFINYLCNKVLEGIKDLHQMHSNLCKHKWGQLDHVDHQDLQDHQDLKDFREFEVNQENLDHQDHQVQLEREVFQVNLEKMEILEKMVDLDQLELQDHQVLEACLVCLDFLELKGIEDSQD